MKAAVLYAQKDIRYEDIDTPTIGDEDVLVRVKVCGICGSDIPRVLGKGAHYYPIVLGHEFSGEIAAVGNRVDNLGVGDRVTCAPLIPCHYCPDCYKGNFSQCKKYTFIGSRIQGAWAEYVRVPAINVVKLPDGVSFEEGAFFEPATVALHGISLMQCSGGMDIAITGMGTIGMLTLQWAKIFGAKRIFALDIDETRLSLAGEMGADYCLNTRRDGFKEVLLNETGGAGINIVIETAGVAFTEKLCLEIAANKGQIMYIGTPTGDITFTPREFENIMRKELTIRGSWMSYSAPFPGQEWELTGHYFKKGVLKCDKLIHRVMPLANIADALKELEIPGRVKGKILLQC